MGERGDKQGTGAPLKSGGATKAMGMGGHKQDTGAPLPKANMDFIRKGVGEDAPTLGPRTA